MRKIALQSRRLCNDGDFNEPRERIEFQNDAFPRISFMSLPFVSCRVRGGVKSRAQFFIFLTHLFVSLPHFSRVGTQSRRTFRYSSRAYTRLETMPGLLNPGLTICHPPLETIVSRTIILDDYRERAGARREDSTLGVEKRSYLSFCFLEKYLGILRRQCSLRPLRMFDHTLSINRL